MRLRFRLAGVATLSCTAALCAVFLSVGVPSGSAAWSPGTLFALPVDIAVSGSHAWVVNNYESLKSPIGNSVTELNVSNGSLVRIISLSHIVGGLTAPNSIAASGAHVWVTDLNRIIELNASNGSVVRVIKAKARFHAFENPPALFAIAASGTKVWAVNLNSVLEINASNGTVEQVIHAKADRFSMPFGLVVSGSHVWVMNNVVGDRITELNGSNGSLVRVIRFRALVGFTWPDTIAVSGTHLWVTNENTIIELNASNGSLVRVIKANADGFEVMPAVYAFDAIHIWVVNTQSNSLTELNSSNGSLVRVIK